MKLAIKEGFTFKRKRYPTGGYILSSKFSETELNVLAQMGKIEYEKPKPKAKPKAKAKAKAKVEKSSEE